MRTENNKLIDFLCFYRFSYYGHNCHNNHIFCDALVVGKHWMEVNWVVLNVEMTDGCCLDEGTPSLSGEHLVCPTVRNDSLMICGVQR